MATTARGLLQLILGSALWLTAAGIVVRGCSAIKEIVFAGMFGVSRGTDLFVLAFTYSTFLPMIVAGAIAAALIAQLATARSVGSSTASAVPRPMAMGVLACAALAAGSTYVMAPFALQVLFKLKGGELDEAVLYARILAPVSLTMIVAAAMGAVLNSFKKFLVAGLAAAATPLSMIAAIALWGRLWGVEAAAWGLVAGGMAEVVILAVTLRAHRRELFGHPGPAPATAVDRSFWRTVGFYAIASAVAALSPVIDQIFLSKLQTGAITHFNYASKVNSVLIGLFGTAFSVAMYPYLSDLAAQRNTAALKRVSWQIAAFVIPVTAAASAAVFLFSHEIVDLLFARGSFTPADTAPVADIQRVFAFQLVFYALMLVAMRLLNAMRADDSMLWIACLGVAATALFDWLFYERLGAPGIALSSVLTTMSSLIFALLFCKVALRHQRQ